VTEVAVQLVDALTAAYRPYVTDRVTATAPHIEQNDLAAAIDEGLEWLAVSLRDLLELPFDEQPRGPLEVFQEAIRFPTDLLAAHGMPHSHRGEVEAAALPGDLYDLAPASSRDLGERAWLAHLAWGAAKAASFRQAP